MATKGNMSFQEIMTELRQKKYHPIYMLCGTEPYFIDALSHHIQHNILTQEEKAFNLTVRYGKDTDILEIINTAKRYPMGAQRQVIVVREAQHILSWEGIEYYIRKPMPTTILCFCHKHKKLDGRQQWVKEIKKIGLYFESKSLYDNQIIPWIKNYLITKRIHIGEKAEKMLVEYLGNDLSKIVNELEKLIVSLPIGEQEITPENIEKNIGISKDYNVFELQKAFIERDVVKANKIIRYFGDNKKQNPMAKIIPVLFTFFSNLMMYYYLADKSERNVATELKIHPYFVKDIVKAGQAFTAKKTFAIIGYLREYDARSKGIGSVNTEEYELFKELVFKIMH